MHDMGQCWLLDEQHQVIIATPAAGAGCITPWQSTGSYLPCERLLPCPPLHLLVKQHYVTPSTGKDTESKQSCQSQGKSSAAAAMHRIDYARSAANKMIAYYCRHLDQGRVLG
jgi:hypothetical protein